jgi:hypothetical protein
MLFDSARNDRFHLFGPGMRVAERNEQRGSRGALNVSCTFLKALLGGDTTVAVSAGGCLKLSKLSSGCGWEMEYHAEAEASASEGGNHPVPPSTRNALAGWELRSWYGANGQLLPVALGLASHPTLEASFHPGRGLNGQSAAMAAAPAATAEGDTRWAGPRTVTVIGHTESRCVSSVHLKFLIMKQNKTRLHIIAGQHRVIDTDALITWLLARTLNHYRLLRESSHGSSL